MECFVRGKSNTWRKRQSNSPEVVFDGVYPTGTALSHPVYSPGGSSINRTRAGSASSPSNAQRSVAREAHAAEDSPLVTPVAQTQVAARASSWSYRCGWCPRCPSPACAVFGFVFHHQESESRRSDSAAPPRSARLRGAAGAITAWTWYPRRPRRYPRKVAVADQANRAPASRISQ